MAQIVAGVLMMEHSAEKTVYEWIFFKYITERKKVKFLIKQFHWLISDEKKKLG